MPQIKNNVCFLLCFLIVGCDNSSTEINIPLAPIKAIQHTTISEEWIEQERNLSGYLRPIKISNLSFNVSGKILDISVHVGDKVTEGQVLATLDPIEFEYRLNQVKAELASARSEFNAQKEHYQRQKLVFEKKIINKSAFETALSKFEQAQSAVTLSESSVALALRDLNNTVLRAPFNGVVTQRHVEKYEEVTSRESVVEIQGQEQLEVAFLVPSNLIGEISQGDNIAIRIPTVGKQKYLAHITKIGMKSDLRGAYPVSAKINKPAPGLHSGMAADVMLTLSHRSAGIVLPESAVIIAPNGNKQVFIYDAKQQKVYARTVSTQFKNSNTVAITQGLNPGDIVCTAGSEFLREGQTVTLYQAVH
ncbi:efflux RND transporter periplasmic adaptor subunit [Thalassotalea fonticola]|uniref:Efflux RND transporter periplasmic adaptor subunit n=1 Tax=Thalassotalea fonticola TaxID=3065649 RepID=A0ABZ0GL69_9GAMM|nr:efflux RND transporter periplasmic adaptor subunit [Colwelliaceae bacterium S1-1]